MVCLDAFLDWAYCGAICSLRDPPSIWLQPGQGVLSGGDRKLCFQSVSLGAEARAALFPFYSLGSLMATAKSGEIGKLDQDLGTRTGRA